MKLTVTARAKINWALDVRGRLPNGYHDLDMLMQPVTLADEVTLTPADEWTLTVAGNPAVIADPSNLALRAAKAWAEATGHPGRAAIAVTKRIPVGAGMGGGSADAAAVLAGLNHLYGTGLSEERLEEIGLTLGADVPFCLRGGLCRVRGIGEKMEAVGATPEAALCVVQPCDGLSTKEIFGGWHREAKPLHPAMDAVQEALCRGDYRALKVLGGNSLQPVSEKERPAIGEAIAALYEKGALFAAMTGSGSAVFGVFASEQAAEEATRELSVRWPVCAACRTCADSLRF